MYHFQLNGIDVTCETAEELYAFASFKSWTPSDGSEPLHAAIDEHHEQNGNGHIDGRTLMWNWVNNYRAEKGCTMKQARNAYRKAKQANFE